MPLITVVVTLIVVGVLLWCLHQYIPIDAKIAQIIDIVVIVAVVLWLLKLFGLFGYMGGIQVGP